MGLYLSDEPFSIELSTTLEADRTYRVKWYCQRDEADQAAKVKYGPIACGFIPGQPTVGDPYNLMGESDPWAFFTPEVRIYRADPDSGHPWIFEGTYTTRFRERKHDARKEDPLLEPARVSGSFLKYTAIAEFDVVTDKPIINSSQQKFPQPQTEQDKNRPTVRIEQNVASLNLSALASAVDRINSTAMWGLGPKTIKLDNAAWSRKVYYQSTYYWTLELEFSIRPDTWRLFLVDQGTRVLADGVNFGTDDPTYCEVYRDKSKGDSTDEPIYLNGQGRPRLRNDPMVVFEFDIYKTTDFIALGVPASLSS